LLRYATRRLNNRHEAEEVVQETLLRACQHEPGFATEDDLQAWATVVTSRQIIDRLRVRGRSYPVPELPAAARITRDTADVVVARDEARAALEALESMPGRQAAVLWAREIEGMSYEEIGERHGLSEPAVRSVLHRARRTLRREYAARGGTLPVGGVVALLAPWRRGATALARLRRAARGVVPVSAIAAVGMLGISLGPWHSGTATPSSVFAAPLSRSLTQTHQTVVSSALPNRGQTIRTIVGHASAAAVGSSAHYLLSHTQACVGIGLKGRSTGLDCGQPTPTSYLVIGPPLPVVGQVWLSHSRPLCTHAPPANPVLSCRSSTPQANPQPQGSALVQASTPSPQADSTNTPPQTGVRQ
jgi:RNA polymerase sigma-70 factor (ECF subfamily)